MTRCSSTLLKIKVRIKWVRHVKPHPIDIPVADSAALDRAADLILKAERPLVMLGAAASRPRLAGPLSDFVRRVRIPFFKTQMGKGSVMGGSGLYMGTAALSERDYVHRGIDRPDLIIAIGHDAVEKRTNKAFESRLFEPKSPFPGNGIFKPETKRPKRPRRFRDAVAETKSR
jgi:thiamine pyrophosphate-dependent acetolactate synthase large subunit-like protein